LRKTIYILAIFIFTLSGCGGLKRTNYKTTFKISQRKLSKELKRRQFSASTFESRFKLKFKDNYQNISGRGRIKIKKDSIIWGSINALGIPIIKFMITPQKVQYYNKLNSEYYDGNFDLINQQLGLSLDFDNLQNLLLGDIVLPVNSKDYQLTIDKKYYQLDAKSKILSQVKMTPFFKVLSEILQHPNGKLSINYSDYQEVGKQNLPKKLQIATQESNNDINISIEYLSASVGKTLRFPFTIPETYTPMRF
jgi:outer membrane biogenesis lipoprotein LolB